MSEPTIAEQAHAALKRHAWREAFDLLAAADARSELGAPELELLAQAAWWIGQLPTAIEVRERAYALARKSGQREEAVMAAVNLGRDNLLRNATTVAAAWLNRAGRLLEDAPENPGHGWLAATRAFHAALVGDSAEVLAQATRALEVAARFGDRDLEAMALSEKGMALVARGEVAEGLALVDEATVAAVGGELDPGVAGSVCCTTIEACAGLGDWLRAAEWTEAQDRWCHREGISGFPGVCRVFRSEIKMLRGDWPAAEAEALRASEELVGFFPAAVGTALYRIGEIRLRRGDLPAAEEALRRAHGLGRSPEPALSLLRLAQGRTAAALTGINASLDEPATLPAWQSPSDSRLYRLSLLPARVEIALAAGELATARTAADEITAIADHYGTTVARADAATAVGAVLLAEGDAPGAAARLREAVGLWSEVDAPYELARARAALARAYQADGAPDRAVLELQAAAEAFERLGAVPDLRRVDEELAAITGTPAVSRGTAERRTRTFVFTDIVDSTRLAELLGDAAWDTLIRWHDQAIRSVVAEHRGEEIKSTGDGFFLAFDDPDQAIESAIGIQRRLAEHREAEGFALSVRIGLHLAEANRRGLDYSGTGVNQAARIGAAAGAGEILASAATLEAARRPFAEADRRSLTLKGLSGAVEVVSIGWR